VVSDLGFYIFELERVSVVYSGGMAYRKHCPICGAPGYDGDCTNCGSYEEDDDE